MTATASKLKSTAGTLELQPACDAILKQVRGRRFLVIPGVRARIVALAARLCPGLMRWFSERIVKSMFGAEPGNKQATSDAGI